MRSCLLSVGVVAAVAALAGVDGTFIFGTATTGTVAAGTAAGAAGLAALGGLALGIGELRTLSSPSQTENLQSLQKFITFTEATPPDVNVWLSICHTILSLDRV